METLIMTTSWNYVKEVVKHGEGSGEGWRMVKDQVSKIKQEKKGPDHEGFESNFSRNFKKLSVL